MPLLSIIIPVYNVEHYLEECIQSVLNQDFKNLEIILINDGSTDKSGDICDSFAQNKNYISVIHQKENFGVSVSRNAGLEAAKGKYSIFLDSDDYLYENTLSGLAKLINEKPQTDVFIGKFSVNPEMNREFCFENIFNKEKLINNETDDLIPHIKRNRNFYSMCWYYIIKLDFIKRNNLYFSPQVRIFEDTEFVTRMLCLGRKFSFYDELFYCYNIRPGSLGQSISEDDSLSGLIVVNNLCKLLKNNDIENVTKDFIYSKIKFVLNFLTPCMIINNRKTLHRLSIVISNNLENLSILNKISQGFDLYFFINTFGTYYGLILYKSYITEKVISLTMNTENKEIYIFCAGIYGESIAHILKSQGYTVKGFIDNNTNLHGTVIQGLNVYPLSILSNKSRDELNNVFVIINNKSKTNINEISTQLRELGINEVQINSSDIL